MLFPGADPLALQLLQSLLEFNPRKRITVDHALRHSFLSDFHSHAMEVVTDRPMDVEVEVVKEAPENLKMTVAEEISRYWTAVPRTFSSESQTTRPLFVKPEVTSTFEVANRSSYSNNSSSSSMGAGSNKSIGPPPSSGSGMEDAIGYLGSLHSTSESSGKSMLTEGCTGCGDNKKPLASVYDESTSDTDASLFGLPEERTSCSGSNSSSSSSSSDASYQNDSSSVVGASLTRHKSKAFFLF